jgi:TPR repeat protein
MRYARNPFDRHFPSGAALLEASEMLISNRFVRTYLFGSKVAIIHNKSFQCCVSTAKEGLFQKQSTIVLEPKIGSTVGAGAAGLRLCGKVIYSPTLRKSDRLQFHDVIAKTLDAAGEEGCTLEEALEQIFTDLKRRGIAVGTVNLAADRGQADAQFNLGGPRINGEGVPQGDTQAVFWYRNAAEQGLRRKHRLYFDDTDQHSPEDYTRLAAWLRKAAEQGDAEAQFTFGYLYDKGQGVPQDYAQAVYWYRKAAERGFALAQDTLGVLYDNGLGVPQDYTQAAAWYRRAAEQGAADAQFNLGRLYHKGHGVPQDDTQSAFWFRKAAEQGNPEAQYLLGLTYTLGDDVPQDYTQAAAWYRKAAEQGVAGAQFKLGLSYKDGRGVPQDDIQAAAWFRKAAEQGDAEAQLLLGLSYYLGLGVPQDYAEAYFWLDRAAAGKLDASNTEQAAKFRARTASHLTPAALARVQERARKWLEVHQAKPHRKRR